MESRLRGDTTVKNGHRTTRRAEWLLSSRPRGVPCSRSVGTVHGLSKLLGFDLQVQNPFAGCVQHPKVEPLALSRCCFLRSARSNAVYQMYMSASKGAQSVAFFYCSNNLQKLVKSKGSSVKFANGQTCKPKKCNLGGPMTYKNFGEDATHRKFLMSHDAYCDSCEREGHDVCRLFSRALGCS